MKTPLMQAVKAWSNPDPAMAEMFPPFDRTTILHYAKKLVKQNSLSIPDDSRLWDSSIWDYFNNGTWFHTTSNDISRSFKVARKRGFPCDGNEVEYMDGYRKGFPRSEEFDWQNTKQPRLP